jgi:hypothetical protein
MTENERKAVINISLDESKLNELDRGLDNVITVPTNAWGMDDEDLTASVSLSDVGQERLGNDADRFARKVQWFVETHTR